MDKKETVHIILLAVALFSIAYIFFANAITDVYVTIEDGEPVAIQVTEMYSVMQVLFLMLMAAIGTHSFVYLYRDLSKLDDRSKKQKLAAKILEGDELRLYNIILKKRECLQKDLVHESGYPKAKVTRLLEKLDRKGLVKRKPYGNTNKIYAKYN
ncbi:MAG: helix-turn-helix domain-containing protein [Candidatus Aenigmarchaeota archaeon]